MRKIIRKLFWVWDFKKEEQWLNDLAAKGLNLVSVGFCRYEFEEGEPQNYTYRLELLEHHPNHPESQNYIRFIEDTGGEFIGSLMRWVYFRKKVSDGSFDLFSDIDSRITHLKRVLSLIWIVFFLEAYNMVYNAYLYFTFQNTGNLTIFLLLLPFTAVVGWGLFVITRMKNALKKERALHE
ncbi:MAG: DUF2812 domain-containing protein [Bacillota bacterium]|nr:DUF2812 domain-containing protein [Bacillota bacterium]